MGAGHGGFRGSDRSSPCASLSSGGPQDSGPAKFAEIDHQRAPPGGVGAQFGALVLYRRYNVEDNDMEYHNFSCKHGCLDVSATLDQGEHIGLYSLSSFEQLSEGSHDTSSGYTGKRLSEASKYSPHYSSLVSKACNELSFSICCIDCLRGSLSKHSFSRSPGFLQPLLRTTFFSSEEAIKLPSWSSYLAFNAAYIGQELF